MLKCPFSGEKITSVCCLSRADCLYFQPLRVAPDLPLFFCENVDLLSTGDQRVTAERKQECPANRLSQRRTCSRFRRLASVSRELPKRPRTLDSKSAAFSPLSDMRLFCRFHAAGAGTAYLGRLRLPLRLPNSAT